MQYRITIKTLESPQSTHLVRFCIFQCMLVFLLDLWNLLKNFNFLCINYFLNCMCVLLWCICHPQKSEEDMRFPKTGVIDGYEQNPGPCKSSNCLLLLGRLSSPSVFLKYSFLQHIHEHQESSHTGVPLQNLLGTLQWPQAPSCSPYDNGSGATSPPSTSKSCHVRNNKIGLWGRGEPWVCSIGLYRIALRPGLFLFG